MLSPQYLIVHTILSHFMHYPHLSIHHIIISKLISFVGEKNNPNLSESSGASSNDFLVALPLYDKSVIKVCVSNLTLLPGENPLDGTSAVTFLSYTTY